ncbi:MAG: SH3 domain-containing protein [Burkholderiaceae bacterium]
MNQSPSRTSVSKLLALAACALLMPLQASAQQMVSVTGNEVNFREGPGSRYESNWLLARGYPLQVIGRQGSWLKVRDFENDQGWVHRSLTGKVPHHIVKSRVANVRALPSTQSRVLGKLAYGDVVKTVKRQEGWVKVRQEGGLTGWIARRLLWGW